MNEVIKGLPVIALKGMTILPYMVIHFDINRKNLIETVEYAMLHGQKIFITGYAGDEQQEDGREEQLRETGTVCEIKQIMKLPGSVLRVMVRGMERGKSLSYNFDGKIMFANVETSDAEGTDELLTAAYVRELKELARAYAVINPRLNKEIMGRIMAADDISELIYRIIAEFPFENGIKLALYDCDDIIERCNRIREAVNREIDIAKIRKQFMEEVHAGIDKHQKEYVLREQMRVIREELGEESEGEIEEFLERTKRLNASDEIKQKINKEIGRYRSMAASSAEANVIRSYIETLLDMPWDNMSEDNNDIKNARRVLDKEHYGLDKVKERVLEFLAVRQLNGGMDSPVVCLVGPPGTGKTSIAASIAGALGKKYVRICLGGVRDEAEIRGHRRTYVGAMPGRIIEGIRSAGVKNPLLLLDEIDKTGKDSRGDTASALLEVLDSAQNSHFVDHYMEVPVDLSQVLFIATANDASMIPKPLYDRMEIIELSSYTENEKLHIASEHLVEKQLEKNGLSKKELNINKTALAAIIHGYTREAGVRNLERRIAQICRVTAKKKLAGEYEAGKQVKVTAKNLEDFLGKPRFKDDHAEEKAQVGTVTGLAWTSVGGDTLTIEVGTMPGKGEMILTGNLGDVMKESARIALSYVRSVASQYGVKEDFFGKNDIHIHIPEGAVPKDGPSAGITMSVAILSAVSNIPVRARLAMTGEVTLRGRVLPIGGLKEKLLAAKQYGIKKVLIPEQNQPNAEELDAEITEGMELVYVSDMSQVERESLVKD
mgnify:FL=1